MEITVFLRAIPFFHNESQPSGKIKAFLLFRRENVYYSNFVKMGKKALLIKNTLSCPPLENVLSEGDFNVDVATSWETGLRHLVSQVYDIAVVIDNHNLESWQYCRIIKSMTDIPLIVIDADATPETCAKAINAGADFFMRKPFGPLEFLARVNSLLQRPSYRQVAPVG